MGNRCICQEALHNDSLLPSLFYFFIFLTISLNPIIPIQSKIFVASFSFSLNLHIIILWQLVEIKKFCNSATDFTKKYIIRINFQFNLISAQLNKYDFILYLIEPIIEVTIHVSYCIHIVSLSYFENLVRSRNTWIKYHF